MPKIMYGYSTREKKYSSEDEFLNLVELFDEIYKIIVYYKKNNFP